MRSTAIIWLCVATNLCCVWLAVSADQSANTTETSGETDGDDDSSCFVGALDEQVSANKVSTLSPTEISRILIEGSHSFAFDLIKALHKFETRQTSAGLLVSPSSIWSALIITYMGANGDTERELRTRLKLQKLPKVSVGMAYQGLRLWNDLKRNVSNSALDVTGNVKTTLSQANKIFINNKLKLSECFDEFFHTDIQEMNFSGAPVDSLNEINDWVKNETSGKIVDLLPNGAVNPWTKIIIANAIYFKSLWLNQFNADDTKAMPFFVSPTEEITVDMMSMETTIMYGISERLQATAVELPYANPDYSMVIILPHASKGLDALIQSIRSADLYELVSTMYDDEVNVVLPKFKVEQQFELAGPLYSMGVRRLFDPRFANLTAFFDNSTHAEGIALNSVVHKSYIAVNEEGTEAAAATAIIYGRSGRPVFPTQFVANRPFLYLIRDVTTNFILFLGTVRRPQK